MYFSGKMKIKSFLAINNKYEKSQPVNVDKGHFHTITYRISGKKIITEEDGIKLVSERGCITYLPKNIAYTSDTEEGGKMYSVNFELEEEDALAEAFVLIPKTISAVSFENAFRNLCDSYSVFNPDDYRTKALLYELFAMIKKECDRKKNIAIPKRILVAKETIDKEFNDSSLSVSSLAENAGVSQAYFRREFKACFGISPIEYIRNVRIENAKMLLRSGLYSISETATESGFDSISYFSSTFRKLCGMTPSEYAESR